MAKGDHQHRVSDTMRAVGGGEIEVRNVHRAVAVAAHMLAAHGPRALVVRAGGALRPVYMALSRLSESYDRLMSVRLEGDVDLERVQEFHRFLERVHQEAVKMNERFRERITRIERGRARKTEEKEEEEGHD